LTFIQALINLLMVNFQICAATQWQLLIFWSPQIPIQISTNGKLTDHGYVSCEMFNVKTLLIALCLMNVMFSDIW